MRYPINWVVCSTNTPTSGYNFVQ